jgi:hypothetical protein
MLFRGPGIDAPTEGVEHVVEIGEEYEDLIAAAPAGGFPDALPDDTLAGLFYTGGRPAPPRV